MEKEFNLSDKTHWFYDGEGNEEDWYKEKDIKELIRRLREITKDSMSGGCNEKRVMERIDKIIGRRLI